jgi:serine/threonine protein kinase/tetratricopeptide (TPR) repeat protein
VTSTQWELVKETFEAALDRPQPERSAFIVDACQGDDEVRREVESLLSAHERDADFMNEPVGALLPNDEPVLAAGQPFGHYEQISLLGKGGMGQVYVAVDTRLGRKVALKLLPSTLTNDPTYVPLLEREARAASALNHPNIITIHDIGEVDSIHFITTEFVEGETLRERMSRTPMSISEALDTVLQVAAALQAAHESGIVHRDIKPENIMLRRDGVIKVLDFGLAKLTHQYPANIPMKPSTLSNLQTHAGAIKGTVAYMSPEQTQADDVDSRTDLWSLGVVLYEMIAGHTPFNGDTPGEVMIAIREHDPPQLQQPTVPKELLRIITKGLNKNPAERYQTASELAIDLKNVRLTGKRYKPLAVVILLLVIITTIAYFAINRNKTIPVNATNRSIAVLPFIPVDATHRDEIFETGMADVLIQRLSTMQGITVRSLSATREYQNLTPDPVTAGREQQVDYVIASSYHLQNGKIRIAADVVNVGSGKVEQTYNFEKESADVLALQDAISNEIGGRLQRQFATDASERPAKRGTSNSEAYRLYLQGMYLANKRNRQDAEKAIEILGQAAALDPDYARAWAGLAYAHRTLSLYTPDVTTHDTYQKSMSALNKALALDQNLSEAHSALCENKYLYEWDFAGAEAECKRAIELDGKSAQAHEIYSRFLMGRGRHEEAIFEIETAIDLEPASRFSQRNYGRALYYARRYPEAASQLERVLEMDQTFVGTYSWLTSTLALQGNEAKAFEWFRKLLSYRKVDEATLHIFEKAFQKSGWRGVLSEWLKRTDQIGGSLFDRACYNAQIGNKDQAFNFLEQIYQRREIWMTYLGVDPRLDSLRDDPRYFDLLRRVEGK